MLKRLKINHWLGLLFLSEAVCIGWALRKFLRSLVDLGFQQGVEVLGVALVALFVCLSIMFVFVGMAAIGLFRGKVWGRRLAFTLTGLRLFSIIAQAFMFGIPPWGVTKISSMGISLLLLWVLWKSKTVRRVFGPDGELSRIATRLVVATGVLAVLSLGTAQLMQIGHRGTEIQSQVTYHERKQLEPGFVSRELFHFRLALPADSQIWIAENDPPPLGRMVMVGSPDKHRIVIVAPDTTWDLIAPWLGRRLGFPTTFNLHHHALSSRWSPIFVWVRRATSSHVTRRLAVQSPQWSGFEEQELSKQKIRVEYSLYQRTVPHQSASCTWTFPEADKEYETQVQRAMSAFEFLPAEKIPQDYRLAAREKRAGGQILDAQFALTQAYLLGSSDAEVTRELAQVSAQLGSWVFVKRLTEELLEENPMNARDQELLQEAIQALKELRETPGSNPEGNSEGP